MGEMASIQDSATLSSTSVPADCEGSGPAKRDTSGDGVPTAPSNTWRAARHTRSMKSREGLTQGRPPSTEVKTCHLCGASEGDDDPVQLPYGLMGNKEEQTIKIRWKYPRVNGAVRGNFCWYCVKAAELKCPNDSLSSVKERVDLNMNDAKKKFFNWRKKVVESVIETGTWSTKNVKESVMVEESASLHSSHRGRLVSVRKFKKETGQTPAPGSVITKRSRTGKMKDMVKVYDHCDSSSWSFTDSDAEVVKKQRVVDDGSIVVDEEQMQAQYDSARKMQMGDRGHGKSAHQRRQKQASPGRTRSTRIRPTTSPIIEGPARPGG